MKLLTIDPQWRTFWDLPNNNCDHVYDDDAPIADGEYTGSYICIHCNEVISYDVADFGD